MLEGRAREEKSCEKCADPGSARVRREHSPEPEGSRADEQEPCVESLAASESTRGAKCPTTTKSPTAPTVISIEASRRRRLTGSAPRRDPRSPREAPRDGHDGDRADNDKVWVSSVPNAMRPWAGGSRGVAGGCMTTAVDDMDIAMATAAAAVTGRPKSNAMGVPIAAVRTVEMNPTARMGTNPSAGRVGPCACRCRTSDHDRDVADGFDACGVSDEAERHRAKIAPAMR